MGSVTGLPPDSVAVRPNGLKVPVTLPRQSITRVDLSRGPNSGSRTALTLTGMLIGLLGGATIGVVGGDLAKKNAAKAGAVGAVVGIVIGGGIGYALPGEAWQRAQFPAGPDPTRGPTGAP